MELIDRYLAAVRRNLPPAKANDIVAELRDEIDSRIEEREAARNRPLSEDETSALLKEFGHPLVVASRFRSHQWLIGPETFPFYFAALRIVLLVVSAIVIAVAAANVLFGGQTIAEAGGHAFSSLWSSLLGNFALVTIVFAVMERKGLPVHHLVDWVPDHLPEVGDKQPGPWESAFEVAMGIAFILWWTGVIPLPVAGVGDGFRIEADPVIWTLYWPVLVLGSARLVYNIIQWLRPRWKTVRAILGGATTIGSVALLVILYRAGQWAHVVSTGMKPEEAMNIENSLNLALRIAIVVVAVIWTFGFIGGAWRFFRERFDRG